MNRDRRKRPRNNVNLIVEIKSRSGTEYYHLGMTKNLSADGFCFESQNYNILQGQVLEFDIKMPDSNLSVSAVGKGVWVKITDFECLTGIEFLGLDEEAKNRIAQLLSSPTPEPGTDMHHEFIPEAYESKIDNAIVEASSTASQADPPVNDESSIPEYSNIADNEQAVLSDKNMERLAATAESKVNKDVSHKRYENSPNERPRPVKNRTAAEVSSRKKRSHVPFAIISIVTIIAVASIFGVMKWTSSAPAPDSSQTALHETDDAIINREPWPIGTPVEQDTVSEKDMAVDVPNNEQPVIRTDTEHDNTSHGTGLTQKPADEIAVEKHIVADMSDKKEPVIRSAARVENASNEIELPWEHVPINDSGKPSDKPELDKTAAERHEALTASLAPSIAKSPPVKIETPASKETVTARNVVENIPEHDKPGRIIIPSTYGRQAYLENIRHKIQQEATQTQTPSAIKNQAFNERSDSFSEANKEPATVVKLPETTKRATDNIIIANAIPDDKINSSRTDMSPEDQTGTRKIVKNTIEQAHNQSVSEPVSSSHATPLKKTQKDVPEKNKISSLKEETHVPLVGVIALRVSPRNSAYNNSTSKKIKTYDESFNQNTNDWDTFNTSSAIAEIQNGAYIIENKREEGAHLLFHEYDFPAASDFTMETSLRLLENSAKASFGVIFGANDSFNNYTFQITTNKLYTVRNYHQGVSREIIRGGKGAVPINIYALNKLKIVRQGNNMSFYINNKFVDTITDVNLYGKKFGFIIDGRSKIAIEHMRSEVQVTN